MLPAGAVSSTTKCTAAVRLLSVTSCPARGQERACWLLEMSWLGLGESARAEGGTPSEVSVLKKGVGDAPWSHVLWTNLGGVVSRSGGGGEGARGLEESVRCLRCACHPPCCCCPLAQARIPHTGNGTDSSSRKKPPLRRTAERLTTPGSDEWHMALSLSISSAENLHAHDAGTGGGEGWAQQAMGMRVRAAVRDIGPEFWRRLELFDKGGGARWMRLSQHGARGWAGKDVVEAGESLLGQACSRGMGVIMIGCIVQGNIRGGLWGPSSLERSGIGGSEQAVVHLSRELQRHGWQVIVFGRPPEGDTGFGADGVLWLPWYLLPAGVGAFGGGCGADVKSIYIAWREQSSPRVIQGAGTRGVWLHDAVDSARGASLEASSEAVDNFFVLSSFHASQLPASTRSKAVVTRNGVADSMFVDGPNHNSK